MVKAAVEVFIAHAPEDEAFRNALVQHLAMLDREGAIHCWHRGLIAAGEDSGERIAQQLDRAQVVLALISASFLSTRDCYEEQLERALERRGGRKTTVIPVIVKDCDWQRLSLRDMKPLPQDGSFGVRPVARWDSQDDAWANVVRDLRDALQRIGDQHPSQTILVHEPPPEPPSVFVGRDAELVELASALLSAPEKLRPVMVHGMPGVGKTHLVERFVSHEAAGSFPGGVHHFVLRPEDEREEGAIEQALLVQLRDRVRAGDAPLHVALRSPRALVYVENVDELAAARAVDRLARRLAGCPLVVTGRSQELVSCKPWRAISVAPFDEESSLRQLTEEIGDALDDGARQDRRRLARELGHLPLALHLAAGLLRDGDYQVDTVLGYLERKKLDVEPDVPSAGQRDPARRNLRKTFELSLELLKQRLGPDDARLSEAFSALGHAPPSGFGRSLGAAMAGLDDVDFDTLISATRKLSLIAAVQRQRGEHRMWQIHPLLARMLQDSSSAPVRERMAAWFKQRLPELPPAEGERMGRCWSEVQAESDALTAWLGQLSGDDAAEVCRVGFGYAISHGPYEAWVALCERALEGQRDDEARSYTLHMLAGVARLAAMPERALQAAVEEEDLQRRRGDALGAARAARCRADVLKARGEPDEALRIYTELLDVHERLGNEAERAAALERIAEVLHLRGRFDEALRLRERAIAVHEARGDVRAKAVLRGKVAEILRVRGRLDEALRICREEQLPVFERLGDIRMHAVTCGRIAEILEDRGELDEALRLCEEKQLPVFERLGDVRERAYTLGRIADIHMKRDRLDEALRIRMEEQLPLCKRLGEVRLLASALNRIACIHKAQGDLDAALRIHEQEELPCFERVGDVRSAVITRRYIAEIFMEKGLVDDAIQLCVTRVIPDLRRLQANTSLLKSRIILARSMLKRRAADQCKARVILRRAHADAGAMKMPQQLREIEHLLEGARQA